MPYQRLGVEKLPIRTLHSLHVNIIPEQDLSHGIGHALFSRLLAELDALLDRDDSETAVVISAIGGTAGIGKTALAVHWAHRVASRFPDGQLYLNLRGYDPGGTPVMPAEGVRVFLDALLVPPQRIPASFDAQVGLYRSLLAGRRMLVLLDNARNADQVRPLLPGTAGCLALLTSRNQLASLVAVNGARQITLDLLTRTEAWQMLGNRLGPKRLAAEPDPIEEIITRCARLPLALAVVAARASAHPGFPLRDLAWELREAHARLDPLSDLDLAVDVRAAFGVSCRTVSGDAGRLFRLLALHPGPDISPAAAACLLGVVPARARPLLAELTRANLLDEPVPGRYGMHDLLRGYASELTQLNDGADVRRAATGRMLDYYLHTGFAAAVLINPHRWPAITLAAPGPGVQPAQLDDKADAQAWFAREHQVLLGAIKQAAATRFDTQAWQLTWAVADFLRRGGHWHDWVSTQTTALDAAERLADPLAQALIHRSLALAYIDLGSYDDAHTHLLRALSQFHQLGDQVGQAHIHINIGVMRDRQGRLQDALSHARQALVQFRAEGERSGQAHALNGLGWLHGQLGHHQQALDYCQQALTLQRQINDRYGEADTWRSLGYVHSQLGQHRQASTSYERAIELLRDHGDRYHMAEVLAHLGDARLAGGEPDAARQAWKRAVTVLEEFDHPDAGRLRAKLASVA